MRMVYNRKVLKSTLTKLDLRQVICCTYRITNNKLKVFLNFTFFFLITIHNIQLIKEDINKHLIYSTSLQLYPNHMVKDLTQKIEGKPSILTSRLEYHLFR